MNWEYKTIKLDTYGFFGAKVDHGRLEQEMNELGQQGWELVTTLDTNSTGTTTSIVLLLKRPLEG